jgi:hypothetical protein
MAKIAGPVWIVAPERGERPEHPIVLPPDTPSEPPGIWGGEAPPYVDIGLPGPQPHPEHPIVLPGDEHPAHPIAPGGGTPEHPIVLPPETVWPPDAHPEHPIAPGGPGDAHPEHPIAPGGGEPTHPIAPGGGEPTHPIVLPPDQPDGGGEEVGGLDFYQRKTLGFNWDKSFDECAVVKIQAGTTADDLVTVRTVANDGTSSVTYPQDFTGSVMIRVNGMDGYLEGTTTVK